MSLSASNVSVFFFINRNFPMPQILNYSNGYRDLSVISVIKPNSEINTSFTFI